ncbi:hypothetical protein KB236_09405 [Levilactobacillus brevis]|nr:hypothetical protein KB236_09405 [Levilactobacillus brevis]
MTSAAIAIEIGIFLMGEGFSSSLIRAFKSLLLIVKWDPVNMLFLRWKYGNLSYYTTLRLKAQQLTLGEDTVLPRCGVVDLFQATSLVEVVEGIR